MSQSQPHRKDCACEDCADIRRFVNPATVPVGVGTLAQMLSYVEVMRGHLTDTPLPIDLALAATHSMLSQLACDVSINGTKQAVADWRKQAERG